MKVLGVCLLISILLSATIVESAVPFLLPLVRLQLLSNLFGGGRRFYGPPPRYYHPKPFYPRPGPRYLPRPEPEPNYPGPNVYYHQQPREYVRQVQYAPNKQMVYASENRDKKFMYS